MATANAQLGQQDLAQVHAELAQLAESDLAPEVFFARFLDVLVPSVDAVGAIAWGLNQQGLLSKIAQTGEIEVADKDNLPEARLHVQLLLRVLHSGRPDVRLPASAGKENGTAQQVRLLAPLHHQQNCIGVVEVALPADVSADRAGERLRLVSELVGYASRYMGGLHASEPTADHPEFLSRLEQIALRLHGRASSRQVCQVAANEGRLLLGCDRVSVAVRRGKDALILAVSGQDRVIYRSNLVRAMTGVAKQTLQAGQAIRYTGTVENLPPQIEKPLVDYLAESGARRLEAVPLYEPLPTDGDETKAPERRSVIGVLLAEHLADNRPTASPQGIEKFSAHVAQALHNARSQERIFLLPLWRAIGSCFAWSARSRTKKVLLVATLVLAALVGMAFVPVTYRVAAEGRLVPVHQRRVFAPQDGEVVEVFVRGGERVVKGQPLLRLHNDDLAIRTLMVRNQLAEKLQSLSALEAEQDEARRPSSRDDYIRLRGRISQTRIEIDGLQQRLAALEQEQSRLAVRAEIDGTVATFQPAELLAGRPVQRGQLLLELMQEDGPWQLELQVPAHRLGHIRSAQSSLGTDHLAVKYVVATLPERTFTGHVDLLSTRATVSADRSSVIPVHVTLDNSPPANLTVGAEVAARIDCGKKSLAYTLFGDLVEFLQRRFW